MSEQGTTDRCPTCGVPHMPGQTRPQSFACTDPWHTQGTTDPEDVLTDVLHHLLGCDGDCTENHWQMREQAVAEVASLRADLRNAIEGLERIKRHHGTAQCGAAQTAAATLDNLEVVRD